VAGTQEGETRVVAHGYDDGVYENLAEWKRLVFGSQEETFFFWCVAVTRAFWDCLGEENIGFRVGKCSAVGELTSLKKKSVSRNDIAMIIETAKQGRE